MLLEVIEDRGRELYRLNHYAEYKEVERLDRQIEFLRAKLNMICRRLSDGEMLASTTYGVTYRIALDQASTL
jgi:hypothetical protein